jgi:hypothetical protein
MEMGLAQTEYNQRLARAKASGGQSIPRGLRVKDPGRPVSPKDLEKAKDLVITTNKAMTQLDRALSMRGEEGWKIWTSRAGRSMLSNLALTVAKAQGISAEGLAKVAADPGPILGLPSDLGGIGDISGQLQAVRDGLETNANAALDTYNLTMDTAYSLPGVTRRGGR